MNFSFFIAKRYFNTSKHKNFIHIISWVSLIAVAIGTAALIILLSVFNGFEDLILKCITHLTLTLR
jgi:lipoprotein-releasing system permease protein